MDKIEQLQQHEGRLMDEVRQLQQQNARLVEALNHVWTKLHVNLDKRLVQTSMEAMKYIEVCIKNNQLETVCRLERKQNDGRGVTCVRSILTYIDRGAHDDALTIFNLDFDKIRQYPDLAEALNEYFGTDNE